MQSDCLAYAQGEPQRYPTPKPKKAIPTRRTWIALLRHGEHILLEKRPSSGIWGGLYSLPEFDATLSADALHAQLQSRGYAISQHCTDTPFLHTFSHFKLELCPFEVELRSRPAHIASHSTCHWVPESALASYGLPAPIQRYLHQTLFGKQSIR